MNRQHNDAHSRQRPAQAGIAALFQQGNPSAAQIFIEKVLALDAFPRTGGTTTADALWMGVQVITLAGQRYVERISASKLTALDLETPIARDREAYIDKAMELARDGRSVRTPARELRDKMTHSPLCDGATLAREMVNAFQAMWQAWSTGTE